MSAGPGSKTGPRLLYLTEIDEADELELVWASDFRELEQTLTDTRDNDTLVQSELHDKCQTTNGQIRMTNALTYGIICDRMRASAFLRYLTLIVKDQFAYCCKQLVIVAKDKFPKMNDRGAIQNSPQQASLLWLVKELVSLGATGIEKVCAMILRQVQGGCNSQPNRWLAKFMLEIFTSHKAWLYTQPNLIPQVFYTFARVAADHSDIKYEKMRRAEASLCCELWRERPNECRLVGRDGVRVLQDMAGIPEFEEIWNDLLEDGAPSANLMHLLSTKTPSSVLLSRLTPDMETQLKYVMSHVKMGEQQRYQKWFMQRWGLQTPEGESLIADLVRFICSVHHPPNEVIRSNVVQRWAAVGWLLKCAKTATCKANIKLAIFYDWLFFTPRIDSVMNVEPAALLITRSIPKWLDIAADLIEFMLAVADEWGGAALQARCRRGMYNAAAECVHRGVIQSWAAVSVCPQINPGLRARLRAQLQGLCKGDPAAPPQDAVDLFASGHSGPPFPAAPQPGQAAARPDSPTPSGGSASPGSAERPGLPGEPGRSSPAGLAGSPTLGPGEPGVGLPIALQLNLGSPEGARGAGGGDEGVYQEAARRSPVGIGGENAEGRLGAVEVPGELAALSLESETSALLRAVPRGRGAFGAAAGVALAAAAAQGGAGGAAVRALADLLTRVLADELSSPERIVGAAHAPLVPTPPASAPASPRGGADGALYPGLARALAAVEGGPHADAAAELAAHMQTAHERASGALLAAHLVAARETSDGAYACAWADVGAYARGLQAQARRAGGEEGAAVARLALRDLRWLFEQSTELFLAAVAPLARALPAQLAGNHDLLALVCGAATPAALAQLAATLRLGEATLLAPMAPGKGAAEANGSTAEAVWADAARDVVRASLRWESGDQQALWMLCAAEAARAPRAPAALAARVVPLLDDSHAEAAVGLAVVLLQAPPAPETLAALAGAPLALRRCLVAAPVAGWAAAHPDALAAALVGEGGAGVFDAVAGSAAGPAGLCSAVAEVLGRWEVRAALEAGGEGGQQLLAALPGGKAEKTPSPAARAKRGSADDGSAAVNERPKRQRTG